VTPHDLLGRATAINSLAYGSRSVGAAIGALVGGLHGAETCLVVAAIGFLAQALVIVVSRVFPLVEQPSMPSETRHEHDRPHCRGALLSAG